MWNIFRGKQNLQQGQKNIEEDGEQVMKQLRVKFEVKMKTLSQKIKQSQQFFSQYSQIPPKQQQLSSTFQDIITTLQGLISIIEQLRQEIDQTQQQLDQLKKAKHMVANHHSIVNNLQQSYNQQIRAIYSQHEESMRRINCQREGVMAKLKDAQAQKEEIKDELVRIQEINANLEIENQKLRRQNTQIQKQLHEISLKYNKSLEGMKVDAKKIINFDAIKFEYLFYYGRLKQGITQFLLIKDFHQLKRLNKYFRFTLQRQQSKFLYKSFLTQSQQKKSKQLQNIKYYQKIMQLFPAQNIKLNAIKYLHFKIKPAIYILPYLQEEIELPEHKEEQQTKEKGKFNWRGFFTSEKHKKEETKFSLSQLKNQEEFKKVEAKLESTFKAILNMKLPQDLVYFSQTMQRQLRELKQNLGSKGPKGTQTAWMAQLHCLCRFMYIEMNQLYNLLQVIFGELIVKSRKLVTIQQANEQLRQNQIVLRNLIQNISHDKSNLQKKSIVIENQILKRNLQRDTLANNFQQIMVESSQIKLKYQNLLIDNAHTKRNIEKLQDQRRAFDQNLTKIKKQLQNLQGAPLKCRKMSQMSASSQGLFKE